MELTDENIEKILKEKNDKKKRSRLINILAKNGAHITEEPDGGIDAKIDPEDEVYWVKSGNKHDPEDPPTWHNLDGPIHIDDEPQTIEE